MLIQGKEVSIEELVSNQLRSNFHETRSNGLVLSDFQIQVLARNQIDYQKCTSMKELSFLIEDSLENTSDVDPELEEISAQIDEYRYYQEIHH